MYTQHQKEKKEPVRTGSNSVSQKKNVKRGFWLQDNRPDTVSQNKAPNVHSPIQLYIANNLDGALDEDSYEYRAESESQGSNSFGENNVARATLILNTGERVTMLASSGKAHSEEVLLKMLTDTYGEDILRQAPSSEGKTRIVEIYTERAPCDGHNADWFRKNRTDTDKNCQTYLTKVLHPEITVSHSVPNDRTGHARLMATAKNRYINEIVSNQRKLTYQNATNRSPGYFKPFINLCYKINGVSGRNYHSEVENTRKYIQRFRATVNAFKLDIDFYTPLVRAFESVPHYNGQNNESRLVLDAVEIEANKIQAEIDFKTTEFTINIEEKDESVGQLAHIRNEIDQICQNYHAKASSSPYGSTQCEGGETISIEVIRIDHDSLMSDLARYYGIDYCITTDCIN